MFRTLCCVLLASAPLAAAANAYPFSAGEDYLAPAGELQGWASTLARHGTQQSDLYRCPQERKACRGRLRSFNKAITRAEGLSPDEQIELVHFYINRTDYDDDRVQRVYDEHGKRAGVIRNHWSTLYDFLVEGGDCEDFATAKYFMLRDLGFSAEDLRVVVVYERKLRGYHAILAVRRTDDSVWLLDSDNFIRRGGHRGYRYVYAMNEISIWDHRADFEPSSLPTAEQ